jgi:hypothetical protein
LHSFLYHVHDCHCLWPLLLVLVVHCCCLSLLPPSFGADLADHPLLQLLLLNMMRSWSLSAQSFWLL